MKTIELKNIDMIKNEFSRMKTVNSRVKKRMKALKMLSDGLSKKEISRRMNLGKNTIYRWAKKVKEEGASGLKDKRGKGRKSILTNSQLKTLNIILKKNPCDVGLRGEKWSGKMLNMYIEKEFEIKLQKSRVYEILKKYK